MVQAASLDTITQALLGAAVGRAAAGRRLGRQAAVWGAIGGALPDLDFVSRIGGPWAEMVHHRGVTHALWFGPVVGPLIGYGVWRLHRRREATAGGVTAPLGLPRQKVWWMLVVALGILSHPLLDLFTSYGTQLFAPFSTHRFAINGVGIIDPAYTLALVAGLWFGKAEAAKVRNAVTALVATTAYLFVGVWLNGRAEAYAAADLSARGVTVAQVRAYPTVLQLFLRRVVARDGGRFHVGWVSMWSPRPIDWAVVEEQDDSRIAHTRASEQGQLFEWFAAGQTLGRIEHDGALTVVELDDLRYGTLEAPEVGMWGIRLRFDAAGRQVGKTERFRRELPTTVGEGLRRMMAAAFP